MREENAWRDDNGLTKVVSERDVLLVCSIFDVLHFLFVRREIRLMLLCLCDFTLLSLDIFPAHTYTNRVGWNVHPHMLLFPLTHHPPYMYQWFSFVSLYIITMCVFVRFYLYSPRSRGGRWWDEEGKLVDFGINTKLFICSDVRLLEQFLEFLKIWIYIWAPAKVNTIV